MMMRLLMTSASALVVLAASVEPWQCDFNADDAVNYVDFLLFADAFGRDDLRFSLDGDSRVAFSDFLLFVRHYGDETPVPEDFTLVFNYGAAPANRLDTRRGVFSKDMIVDPPVSTELSLTTAELDSVEERVREMDFLSLPDEYRVEPPDSVDRAFFSPSTAFSFKLTLDGQRKVFTWRDNIQIAGDWRDPTAEAIRSLAGMIRRMIERKDAYKALPPPRGGYL